MKYSASLDVTIFNTTVNVLEARDFVWHHILPYLCLLGIFTNILNTIVFSHRSKLTNPIYKYFLLHSVTNLAYVTVTFSYFFFVRHFFRINGYFERLFELYIMILFKTVLGFFMMFIELVIASKRLAIVANYRERLKIGAKSMVVFFVVSVVTQLPYLLSNEIVMTEHLTEKHDDDQPCYEIIASDLGKSQLFNVLNMTVFIFRGILAPCMLLVINIAMLVKYRQQLKKKATLKFSESPTKDTLIMPSRVSNEGQERNEPPPQQKLTKASNNLTKMIIAIGFVFVSTNLLVSVTRFFFLFFVEHKNYYYGLAIIENFSLIIAHAFNILIYYHFDKKYNQIFKSIFVDLFARLKRSNPVQL